MQGTLVMLVALSGLGCHNKGCDIAYGPPTYSSCFGVGLGCYADCYPGPVMPSCYAGCYSGGYSGCYGGGYGSCYAGCYGGCYGGGCYGGWSGGCYGSGIGSCYGGYYGSRGLRRHGGCLSSLFSCFHKRAACSNNCGYAYAAPACYGSAYAPAVFGSALGMTYGPMGSGQDYVSVQSLTVPSKQWSSGSMTTMPSTTTMPSEVTTPVPPTPTTPSAVTPPTLTTGRRWRRPPPPPSPAAPTAPKPPGT